MSEAIIVALSAFGAGLLIGAVLAYFLFRVLVDVSRDAFDPCAGCPMRKR